MPKQKAADLAPGLIGAKGQAQRPQSAASENEPLNFKVSPAFKRRFRQAALDEGLRLNELLVRVFEAWEERRAGSRG